MSTQSEARFLIETPPWCPTVECYVHGDGTEHHVEGCPVADTFAGSFHRLDHAVENVAGQIRPLMRKTWRGRVALLMLRIRALR